MCLIQGPSAEALGYFRSSAAPTNSLLNPQPKRHQIDRFAFARAIQQLGVAQALAHVFRQRREKCSLLLCLRINRITVIISRAHQLFEEGRRLRHDHTLNTLLGGNVRELLGNLDRFIQPAIFVDQTSFFPLTAGPYAALADRVDVILIFVSSFADFSNEVVVSVPEKLLKLRPLTVVELFSLTEHAGVLAAHYIFIRYADPIIETFDDRFAADHTDRSGDGRWLGHNFVRVAGDIVPAGSSYVPH